VRRRREGGYNDDKERHDDDNRGNDKEGNDHDGARSMRPRSLVNIVIMY